MTNVDGILQQLKKRKSSIATLSSPGVLSKVTETVSTGCLPLDLTIGGGVPVGRLTELYGNTSTGKSLLAAHILAETQKAGGVAVLMDTETATSEEIMAAVGVNINDLIYSTPETIEQVYTDLIDVIEARHAVAKDQLMTIVWDSVASTSSDTEIAKIKKEGIGAVTMATHARLCSMICRVAPRMISRERIALVFVNQVRDNIGVMFGEKESTFGGRAIPYWSSLRIHMSKISTIKDKAETPIGIGVRCDITKSKVCPPFGKCEFPILFGEGIDNPGAIFWYLKGRKLVTSVGPWWTLMIGDDELKFQQKDWPAMYAENQVLVDDYVMNTSGYTAYDEVEDDEDAG